MAALRCLVDDVDAALPVYEALGFQLVDRRGRPFAVLQLDTLTLWLSGPGTSARRPLPSGEAPTPGGWNRLVIQVPDLDGSLAALVSAGAKVRSQPIKGPGGSQALVEDPSGNPVELYEPSE